MRESPLVAHTSAVAAHRSQLFCQRLTRRARSSFRFAFRTLTPPKRDAMDALYAYMRTTDDLVDGDASPESKRIALAAWRDRLTAALDGYYTHRIHAALHQAVRQYDIPHAYLQDVITGCETDLETVQLATFEELTTYCYRVASVVGLSCVRIWGLKPGANFTESESPATSAGIAFQLTNVLRDLEEDRLRGRIYLPTEDWTRFHCPPELWANRCENFRAMMRFQCDRAERYFREAEPLTDLLSPEGRTIFRLMSSAYRQLLQRIVAADYDVFTKRVRLSRWAKLKLAMRTWLPRRA